MSDDTILAAIARLDAKLDGLRGDVMSKLERMDNQLTGVREDITVTMSATATDAKRTQATRRELADLGELVSGMMRQINRLRTDVEELRRGTGG